MESEEHTNQSYEIYIDIRTARGGSGADYVRDVKELLKIDLRRSGRFPDANFDSRKREGRILVSGVPEDALKEALDRRARTAHNHGYTFTYEIQSCDIAPKEIEKNEIRGLEALLDKSQEELEKTRKELESKKEECLNLHGKLKLLRLPDRNSNDKVITEIEKIKVYPLKAIEKILSGYSLNLTILDNYYKTIDYEYDLNELLEISDMDFEDFAFKEGGDKIGKAVREMGSFFVNPFRRLDRDDLIELRKISNAHKVARLYAAIIKNAQEKNLKLPCVIVPELPDSLLIYIPRGESSKGPASKFLYNTIKNILKDNDLSIKSNKYNSVREITINLEKSIELDEFAHELSKELEESANEILPGKIGYELDVVNFLD